MDDYLDSFENVTHAIKISRDLVSLLKLGGFNLTKFVSNADEITSAMIHEDYENSFSPIQETCNGADQLITRLRSEVGTCERHIGC